MYVQQEKPLIIWLPTVFSTEGLPYSLNRIDLIHMWVTLLEGCSFYDITSLLLEVRESQMRWETVRRVGDLTASPWN